jgi:hypothetical protein
MECLLATLKQAYINSRDGIEEDEIKTDIIVSSNRASINHTGFDWQKLCG